MRRDLARYSAAITSASTQLMRDKVTTQALAEWTIELLRKTGKMKEIESNPPSPPSKEKEKEVMIKTKKAGAADLITPSSGSSQSITEGAVNVKEEDDLEDDADDEATESATTKKKSELSATTKLSTTTKPVARAGSSIRLPTAPTWTSINQSAQVTVLSSPSQHRTLDPIKAPILAISKLLSSHPCKCQECDSTTHEEYVARAKTKLKAKEYQTLNAKMEKDYLVKNQARLKRDARATVKDVVLREIKANALKEAMSTITKQLSMATGTSFQ